MFKEVHVGVFTGCKVLNQAGKCPAEVNMVVAINRGSQYIEAPEVTSTTLISSTPASQQALIAYEEKAADVTLNVVEEPELTIPRVSRILSIGDFQIYRLLGEGRQVQCKTFLALDIKTNKVFALKIIPKDGMTHDSFIRVFKEQALGKALQGCPGAVRIEGSFEDSKNFYIVMVSSVCLCDAASTDDLHIRNTTLEAILSKGSPTSVASAHPLFSQL